MIFKDMYVLSNSVNVGKSKKIFQVFINEVTNVKIQKTKTPIPGISAQ